MANHGTFIFRDEWLDNFEDMSPEEVKTIFSIIKKHRDGHPCEFPEDRYVKLVAKNIIDSITQTDSDWIAKKEKKSQGQKKRWDRYRNEKSKSEPLESNTASESSLAEEPHDTPRQDDQEPSEVKKKPEDSPANNAKVCPEVTDTSFAEACIGGIVYINGYRVVKRGPGKMFKIPTIQEIEDFIKEKCYHFSAKTMFDHYESSEPYPWCMSNGKPVKSWKQCCATFESTFMRNEGSRFIASQSHSPTSLAHADLKNKKYDDW